MDFSGNVNCYVFSEPIQCMTNVNGRNRDRDTVPEVITTLSYRIETNVRVILNLVLCVFMFVVALVCFIYKWCPSELV